jgi:hypothetical protein
MIDARHDRQQMKRALSKEHRQALQVAFVFQGAFGILSGLCLDGGLLLQLWLFAMAGYWGGLILMVCRRPTSPTKVDLFLIRWSFPFLFLFIAMPFSILIWRLRGVWI